MQPKPCTRFFHYLLLDTLDDTLVCPAKSASQHYGALWVLVVLFLAAGLYIVQHRLDRSFLRHKHMYMARMEQHVKSREMTDCILKLFLGPSFASYKGYKSDPFSAEPDRDNEGDRGLPPAHANTHTHMHTHGQGQGQGRVENAGMLTGFLARVINLRSSNPSYADSKRKHTHSHWEHRRGQHGNAHGGKPEPTLDTLTCLPTTLTFRDVCVYVEKETPSLAGGCLKAMNPASLCSDLYAQAMSSSSAAPSPSSSSSSLSPSSSHGHGHAPASAPAPAPTRARDGNIGGQGRRNYYLKGVTSTIHDATSVALMGPSGSGKTTLLNALCGRAHSYGTVRGEVGDLC